MRLVPILQAIKLGKEISMKINQGIGVNLDVRAIDSDVLRSLRQEVENELVKRSALQGPDMESEWRELKRIDGLLLTIGYYRRVTGCSLMDAKKYVDSL